MKNVNLYFKLIIIGYVVTLTPIALADYPCIDQDYVIVKEDSFTYHCEKGSVGSLEEAQKATNYSACETTFWQRHIHNHSELSN